MDSSVENLSRNRHRYRRILYGIAAFFVLSAGLYWYFWIRQPSLADFVAAGMRMHLVQIVEGRLQIHESDPIPNWVRVNIPQVNRFVPIRFSGDFDSATHGPPESNWFVFSIEYPPNTIPPLPSMMFQRIEVGSGGHFYEMSLSWLPMGRKFVYHSDTVPRRDPKLLIRLTELTGQQVEISIDNPFYRAQFPKWTPGVFPAKATRGPFTVELTDFAYGQDGGVHPVVSYTCSDPSLEPCSVFATLEDATGNHGQYISPHETAWKVVAHLTVPPTAISSLNVRYPVGKITVPPANTIVPWQHVVQYGSNQLQIRAIVGSGIYELIKGNWQVATSKNTIAFAHGPAILCDYDPLLVSASAPPYQLATPLTIHSSRGVDLMYPNSSTSTTFESRSMFYLKEFLPGEKLEIELIQSDSERFEFLVAPPEKAKQLYGPHIPGQ